MSDHSTADMIKGLGNQKMPVIDPIAFHLAIHQPKLYQADIFDHGLVSFGGTAQPKQGTDDLPPQPVEPYCSRKPRGNPGSAIKKVSIVSYHRHHNKIHGNQNHGLAQPKEGTDQSPPQPVEPYGSRKPDQAQDHGSNQAFLIEHLAQFNTAEDTGGVQAGKPQPQGPQKPAPRPWPFDPYGSRKPSQAVGHGTTKTFLVGHFEHHKSIHGTDNLLAGEPQPEGPKKPLPRPWPLDPYGSKKPSVAHRGGYLGSIDLVNDEAQDMSRAAVVNPILSGLSQLTHGKNNVSASVFL